MKKKVVLRKIFLLFFSAVCVLVFTVNQPAFAEPEHVKTKQVFNKNYNDPDSSGTSIHQTSDGGSLLVGRIGYYNDHSFLLKMDKKGNRKWETDLTTYWEAMEFWEEKDRYGFVFHDPYRSVAKIMEFNDSGELLMEKDIDVDSSSYITLSDAARTPDGSIVITGYDYVELDSDTDAPTNMYDIYVQKVTPSGTTLWAKNLPGELPEYGRFVKVTDEGRILVGGDAWVGASQLRFDDQYVIGIELDQAGDVVWNQTYKADRLKPTDLALTQDGGIIFTGNNHASYYSDGNDLFVLKINRNGEQEWFGSYDIDKNDYGSKVIQNKKGEYVVWGTVGYSNLVEYEERWYMLQLNEQGEKMRDQILLGDFINQAYNFTEKEIVFSSKTELTLTKFRYH